MSASGGSLSVGSAARTLSRLSRAETLALPRLAQLSPEIEEIHIVACEAGNAGYTDPASGAFVFTSLAHLRRGKCCGSKCRHCPFSHVAVKDKSK